MIRRVLVLAAVLLLMPTPWAYADDDEEKEDPVFSESSTYVGLQYLYGFPNFRNTIGRDSTNGTLFGVGNKKGGMGLTARVGMRPIRYMSFEVVFDWVHDFDLTVKAGGLPTDRTFDTYMGSGNIKLFPFQGLFDSLEIGRVQPFLEAGGGVIGASGTGISTPLAFAGRLGGGLDVFVTDSLAITTEGFYVLPTSNLKGMRYVGASLGVTYHFRE